MSIATAGSTAGGTWPYRRTILAVLTISLVLNVFFIAGAVWTRLNGPPQARAFEQRFRGITKDLELNPQQRASFDRYMAASRSRGDRTQSQIGPMLGSAWEAATKPQMNATEVQRLFDEAFDKRREVQREATARMVDFLSTLSPEQRSKFVELIRERRPPRRAQR